MAISRAAGPDGARNTSVTTSKHAAAPPERRSRPGAGGRRQGLAGLRDDAPSHRSATMRHCCGGRRRVRRARAGFEIDRSERSSRAAISRAAGPDGARNANGATSNTHRKAAAHQHTQRPDPTAPATPTSPQAPSNHATQTRGSPSGPPRVHATSSYSTAERPSIQRSRWATTSATWTALRAAPLRRLSPETTRMRPRLPSTA